MSGCGNMDVSKISRFKLARDSDFKPMSNEEMYSREIADYSSEHYMGYRFMERLPLNQKIVLLALAKIHEQVYPIPKYVYHSEILHVCIEWTRDTELEKINLPNDTYTTLPFPVGTVRNCLEGMASTYLPHFVEARYMSKKDKSRGYRFTERLSLDKVKKAVTRDEPLLIPLLDAKIEL